MWNSFLTILLGKRAGPEHTGLAQLYCIGMKRKIILQMERTVTLLLTIYALCEGIDEKLKKLKEKMIIPCFSSDISKKNIYENYQKNQKNR